MWWLRVSFCALSLTLVLGAAGCGSSGFSGQGSSDSLTMSFQGFTGVGIKQQDTVGNTSADVDLCQDICAISGSLVAPTVTLENFTSTTANALFVNEGFADILLDRYTVTFPAGIGIPTRTVQTGVLLPGGTCTSLPNEHCGSDGDCGVSGPCVHPQVAVQVLLYDFATKAQLIPTGQVCPMLGEDNQGNLIIIPGDVTPFSFQTNVSFSGSDETGKRFNVKSGLFGNFADANNCTTSGTGGSGGG
jgi:hypothetical protein